MTTTIHDQLHKLAIFVHRLIGVTFVVLVTATALVIFTEGAPRFLGSLSLAGGTVTELVLLAIGNRLDALLTADAPPAPPAPAPGRPHLYVVR